MVFIPRYAAFDIKIGTRFARMPVFFKLLLLLSGWRWIRTTVGISQQIYSLPHLATLVFAQLTFKEQQLLSIFS